jgi:tight adherence protein C
MRLHSARLRSQCLVSNMNGYIAPLLAAFSCWLILLLPVALRRRFSDSAARDEAWRDRLPMVLRVLRPTLQWYAAGVDRSLPTHKREVLQTQLNAAGAGYMITPAEFLVIRRLALVAGCALTLGLVFIVGVEDAFHQLLAGSIVPFSYLYPALRLRDATKRRQARFEKDFPFFIDVLVLCMKGGLTLTAAVEQAVEQSSDGPVRDEFSRFLRDIRAGSVRKAAFDRLAIRVGVPAVTSFVASVIQAEETGGALSEVLADQARQRRQERFLRAEKLANQAPVKMLFPLIALLFPVTFIIIGFPIVIQLVQSGALNILG